MNLYSQKVKTTEEKNRDEIIKHKEALAYTMEEAEQKANDIKEEIAKLKKKFDEDFTDCEDKHNKNQCKIANLSFHKY